MLRSHALISVVVLVFSTLTFGAKGDEPTPPKPPEPTPIVVEMTLSGSIDESPVAIGIEGTPVGDNLKGLIDRMKKAKADSSVKGLVLQVRNLSIGWGKVHELRTAITDFRASGKKVIAVLEMVGNPEYLVAAAADEIVMPEGGWLMLKGLSVVSPRLGDVCTSRIVLRLRRSRVRRHGFPSR